MESSLTVFLATNSGLMFQFEMLVGRWSQWLSDSLDGASDPLALIIFFAAGVLTSLTPCVYPMIPIVVAYMSGAESAAVGVDAQAVAARKGRVVFRSMMYVAGLALVYTGLGLAAILGGRAFGSMTQNFWGFSAVALVMAVFGLSLLGLFEIRVPSFILERASGGPRKGSFGAVVMGATSAVVAAPCAAPIVFPLAAITARDGRIVFGTVAMLCFSLGLGLLFLFLGIFSGMISAIPRPGGWMIRLKQATGVLMLLLSVWFFYKGYLLF